VAAIPYRVERTQDGRTARAWVALRGGDRRDAVRAWTDPALLKDWWGGELDTELEPDGPYVVRFEGLGQTMPGRVLGYEPGARLAFTWEWEHEADAPRREVDVRVVEIEDGCRIEIDHGPYGETEREQAEAGGSEEGWQHFLPRLASTLTRRP
jgi:uncharacterized protein YndB with AHSA1/START domain